MEKSSGTTDGKFHSFVQTRVEEWGWALLIVALAYGVHWKDLHDWQHSLEELPSPTVSDLLCWAEELPPVGCQRCRFESKDVAFKEAWRPRVKVANVWESAVGMELNLADSAALESLPGIGPILARRIVRFRASMRGFACMSDLSMVWGLDSTLIEELAVRCTLDTGLVRPFCVKALSFDSLQAHPRWDHAGARCVIEAVGRGVRDLDELWERLEFMGCAKEEWRPYLALCDPHGLMGD